MLNREKKVHLNKTINPNYLTGHPSFFFTWLLPRTPSSHNLFAEHHWLATISGHPPAIFSFFSFYRLVLHLILTIFLHPLVDFSSFNLSTILCVFCRPLSFFSSFTTVLFKLHPPCSKVSLILSHHLVFPISPLLTAKISFNMCCFFPHICPLLPLQRCRFSSPHTGL